MSKQKTEPVRLDAKTREWFKTRPFAQTTVMRCEKCGLYYKPSLGHTCKKRKEKNMKTTGAIIVGYDCRPEEDNIVLVVGRKRPNESVEIINAFQGEEAKELYLKLTTKKESDV